MDYHGIWWSSQTQNSSEILQYLAVVQGKCVSQILQQYC